MNPWRACPSGRVRSVDLVRKVQGGVGQVVAHDFFGAVAGVSAAAAITLGGATVAAAGTVTNPETNAVLAVTLQGATVSAQGAVAVAGSASPTLGSATVSAGVQVAVSGAAGVQLGAAGASAAGQVQVRGQATPQLAGAGAVGSAQVQVQAALGGTLGGATVEGNGIVGALAVWSPRARPGDLFEAVVCPSETRADLRAQGSTTTEVRGGLDMSTFVLKEGDTMPALEVALRNPDGSPHNLAGSTGWKLHVRTCQGATITRDMTKVGADADGVLRYQWLASDWGAGKLVVSHETRAHQMEYEVLTSGDSMTFPNGGYDELRVLATLAP